MALYSYPAYTVQKIIYDGLTPFTGSLISNDGDNNVKSVWVKEVSPNKIKLYQYSFQILN